MTTLWLSWAHQHSRICPSCIPCKLRRDRTSSPMCFYLLYVRVAALLLNVGLLSLCFRMLRGANMMQDFPILTWTNNLESL